MNTLITTLTGLLRLEENHLSALEQAAEIAPWLFAHPDDEIRKLCQALRMRHDTAPAALAELPNPITLTADDIQPAEPAPKRRKRKEGDDVTEQALEVAVLDPTQTTPPAGWSTIPCQTCSRSFAYPTTNPTRKPPFRCYQCLGKRARLQRLELLRHHLGNQKISA